jgi:hypothetical protein
MNYTEDLANSAYLRPLWHFQPPFSSSFISNDLFNGKFAMFIWNSANGRKSDHSLHPAHFVRPLWKTGAVNICQFHNALLLDAQIFPKTAQFR